MSMDEGVNIRKIIMSVPLVDADYAKFEKMHKDPAMFSKELSSFNRHQVMKLLKFQLQKKPDSLTLLNRSIARFNAVNKLTRRMLCLRRK